MTRNTKLVFDAVLIFVMGVLAYALGYLIRVILSRQLGLEELGLFYAVFTFVSFFLVLKELGTGYSLRKFIPEFLVRKEYGRIKSSLKFVFSINLGVSLTLALLFILLSEFLTANYFRNELARPLLIILSIFFVIYALYGTLISVFVGFQRSKLYSMDMFFINFMVLIGILVFSRFGILAPAIAYLAAASIGLAFGVFLFLRIFNYFKYKENLSGMLKKRLFKYGFPLLLASIGFVVIAQIDTLMLTSFRTLEEVGVYNVILPTAMLLVGLGGSLALALLPFVSEYWASKKYEELINIIKIIYKNAFIIIVPLSLIVFAFSDVILRVLFGAEFVVGSVALKILTIGMIFFSVATINNSILSAIGRPKIVTKIVLFATIFNIFLNLILIPLFGIMGAAISTSIAYFLVLVMSSYNIGRFVKIKLPLFSWLKTFFSGGVFIWIVFFLRNLFDVYNILWFVFVLFLGGVVYLALIFILKIISVDEVKNLIRKQSE
jgi:stage V sporulation protein B